MKKVINKIQDVIYVFIYNLCIGHRINQCEDVLKKNSGKDDDNEEFVNKGALNDFDKYVENYWRKERERKLKEQAEASNELMIRYAKAYSAQVNGRNSTSLGGWGSDYRQNDRTDQAGHIRAFDEEQACFDAGLR